MLHGSIAAFGSLLATLGKTIWDAVEKRRERQLAEEEKQRDRQLAEQSELRRYRSLSLRAARRYQYRSLREILALKRSAEVDP